MNAWALTVLLAVGGCGDDDEPVDAQPDAGDAGSDAPIAPTAPLDPDPVVPPELGPCPAGWTLARTAEGFGYCDPFGDDPLPCEGATAQRPGERSCTPIGAACPTTGDFATTLPSDRAILFVRAGATDGDGTRERPFGTLAAALSAVADGGVIALAKGRHETQLELDRSIEVIGACAGESTIEAPMGGTALTVRGAHTLTLRDLRLAAPAGVGIQAREGARVRLDGIWLGGVTQGIRSRDSTIEARDVVARDVADAFFGPGVAFECTLGACSFEDVTIYAATTGLLSIDSNVDAVRFAVVLDPERPISDGRAIDLSSGRASMREIAIRGADRAITVTFAEVALTDLYVTSPRRDSAIAVGSGGDVTITRASLHAPRGVGVLMYDGVATLRDVLVTGAISPPPGLDTSAVVTALQSHTLTVERVAVVASRGSVFSLQSEASATGHDFHVEGAQGSLDDNFGIGIVAGEGATLDLDRVHVASCDAAAVLLDEGAQVDLSSLVVEDTGVGAERSVAIQLTGGARLGLDRARIERSRTIAIAVAGQGTRVHGADVAIRDVLPSERDGQYGRAIDVAGSAELDLERVHIERVHDHGVLASGGGMITLRDLVIDSVEPRACTADDCVRHPAGIGIAVHAASLDLARIDVRHAALCGIHVGDDATITLREGRIADCMVGVCARSPEQLGDLSEHAIYERNDRNLDVIELPVPSPLVPLPTAL